MAAGESTVREHECDIQDVLKDNEHFPTDNSWKECESGISDVYGYCEMSITWSHSTNTSDMMPFVECE